MPLWLLMLQMRIFLFCRCLLETRWSLPTYQI
nr:MAG TPA: hypothetical protein [Siphoviridae sp. ctqtA1]